MNPGISNCQDEAKWCKDIIQSNCDVAVKDKKVKYYCKKTCNQCDNIVVYQHQNPITPGKQFKHSENASNI